ncbi:synaptotagmin-like protein 2 isoform X7 [Pelobates fuscus]|uniref:synaptotagmin-like protein 2 isoform X7 n=1 Tax=Pelobates fuscus TaxID=191477 RepID=UPI002FE4F10A
MIDLSFLTETEQEAILQVLQRDADLKKVEEERVRHLQDAVEDESELKYKTGQWFYEAKSKRHRDKIHGADLVRASIRKRKKPTTIAELGMSNKNRAKKSWVNSVNKDLFIPPELYGVMEGPEEVLEELKQAKVETNQSARKVSFLTPDVEKNTLNNGLASPAKLRKNPFNSENAEDVTDSVADEQIPTLENGTEPVEDLPKNDKLSPKVKFGVKLPYPELDEDSQVSLRTTNASLKSVGQPPVPKPRTLLKNDQALDRSNSQMKREDSVNGTGRPRGILKRCSSSSSTDSENIRLAHNESNRIIMPVSPILEVGRESTVTVEGSPESVDRLKHVRFSPKVLQKTPPQSPEPFIGQEIDEFRILDPSLSDLSVTNNKEFFKDTMAIELNEAPVEVSSNKNSLETPDFSVSTSTLSSASLVSDVGDMLDASSSCEEKKKVTLSESSIPDLDITSTGPEHLYAEVKKSPKTPDKKPEIESPEVSKPSVDSKQDEEEMPELKENLELEAPLVPTDIEVQESQFSNPEKLKQMSKSVPAFLHEETDGRDTDSASENSFQSGKHKKSPSSLTNLSGSSGMASMSSVSGSVMSIYSGDFGNVDIKGNIQFAIDYVDQLKEFHVFVSQCKDLAIGDVKRQRSDPYVKSYLLPEKAKMGKRKTAVKKKTLNPAYNEILRYKIDKAALQTQRLNVSVWHNDALGRNSFLGEVEIALDKWDWNNKQMNWYPLQPRTPAAGIGLEKRGEMRLSLKYVPEPSPGVKTSQTGEVHIWIKDCNQLPMLRGNKINSFVKCTILPDTSRKSRQKTRTVDKTPNPVFNHTMVYDGFKGEDLTEACVELTVWDHNKLTNHFLGGLRIGLGTGKSYGTAVDWMDSNAEEAALWEKMIKSSNTWIEGVLPLRMLKMAKLAK